MSSDPLCLKGGEELTMTPNGWGDKAGESTVCRKGGPHQVPLPIPYAVAYSDETVQTGVMFTAHPTAVAGYRLSYLAPRDDDWEYGVLWARQDPHTDPAARLRYDEFHTGRQKRCLAECLCQVCEGPAADPGSGRLWWVFHQEVHATEGRLSKPPTCMGCIALVMEVCPYLQRAAHVYSSPDYQLWGVRGIVFTPGAAPVQRAVEFADAGTLERTLARGLTASVDGLRPEPLPCP